MILPLHLITRRIIFITMAVLCLTPWISPPIALLLGLVIAQFVGHPYLSSNRKATSLLLKISVVGLGFGMNFHTALQSGSQGFLFTLVSITGTLLLGALLAVLMGVERKTAYLVSSGTAICGGSAIAAISPIVQADERQISVSLGIVFILNSIALFLFPVIGHMLSLTATQFGLWCAIAIHDTSSVVGAAAHFGPQALEVATTVKLTRALWIIPLAFTTAYLFKNKTTRISIPYFIGLFVLAMLLNTNLPLVHRVSGVLVVMARAGLTLTLFLIGAGLTGKVLASVGIKPLIQGVILWLVVSVSSLLAVLQFVT